MRNLLLFVLIAALLTACNKDDASHNDSFYMIAKIDGADKTFNVNMVGTSETIDSSFGYIVGGLSKAADDAESFGIVITNVPSQQPITAKTYTDAETDYEVLTTYTDATGAAYEAGSPVYEGGANADAIENHFQVNIVSITQDVIVGTFSGSYYLDGDVTAAKKEITEGKFRIRLSNP